MSEELPSIPGRGLPVSARAPGKCIVFGEHAVVHGAPELVFAVDLMTQVFVTAGSATRLNADSEASLRNAYFRSALDLAWKDGPTVEVRAVSRIPKAAGLGSSAAFVAGLVAALSSVTGGIDTVIPVSAYIPGCPASPSAIIDGVVKLLQSVEGP